MQSKSEFGSVRCDNILGVLKGTDEALASEYVLIGAHYDHIGVSPGGIIGAGADDNASGCSALLQVAEAFAAAPPRRSVIICFFGSEEDGLHGSKAVAQDLPVPKDALVAMVNLDMVGRGDAKEVAVLGIKQNPDLEDTLNRAKRLSKTGVSKVVGGVVRAAAEEGATTGQGGHQVDGGRGRGGATSLDQQPAQGGVEGEPEQLVAGRGEGAVVVESSQGT